MKKIFLTFLLVIFLLPTIALAKGVNLIVASTEIIGYTEETTSLDLTIQNSQNVTDTFSITIWPPYFEGVITILQKYIVKLNPNSNETIKIYFDIPIDTTDRISNFNVTAISLTDESIADSRIISLRIIRKSPIYLQDLKLDDAVLNPGDAVTIETSVSNKGIEPYNNANLRTLLKKDSQIVKRFDEVIDRIEKEKTIKVTQTYVFDRYAEPGTYSVDAELRDNINKLVSSMSTTLKINARVNITHSKSTIFGLLLQTTTIKVKNEGNVESSDIYVTEDIPSFVRSFFFPEGKYTTEKVYDRILYHWYIPSLMPEEERIIKYEINLWYSWIIGLVLVVCFVLAFRYVFSPKIIKYYRHFGEVTRENEIIVSLDVKNRSRHDIKNVVVNDFVPAIFKLVKTFETLKPTLRSTENGTEIVWRFNSLKPGEERILTYRVMPIVDITGSVKLPQAEIKYIDMKKVKKVRASKSVLIKSKNIR